MRSKSVLMLVHHITAYDAACLLLHSGAGARAAANHCCLLAIDRRDITDGRTGHRTVTRMLTARSEQRKNELKWSVYIDLYIFL